MGIKSGSRIEWWYDHHLNSKSITRRRKTGTVLEVSGRVKNVRYVSGSHIKVLFDGNKHPSCVPKKECMEIFDKPVNKQVTYL